MSTNWYLTAPWDSVPVRRGDALGFRAGADYFSDLLAPGLSNSTFDARWITILSWCLQWSHVAWHNAGGGDLSRRDDQRARYAWLRPLELLWVDRTLESGQTTGQLRGRRSIERWRKADRPSSNFEMNSDQFRQYRQVGTYGAYRVTLRTVPGLTIADGWTLDKTGMALANLVNEKLPPAAQLKQKHFESNTKWGVWSKDREAEYWAKHGWSSWLTKPKEGLFPTTDEAIHNLLPEAERKLMEPVLFASDSVRRATAIELSQAKEGWSHADLCDALAASTALSKKIDSGLLTSLPAFSRLADAAMRAMRAVWNEIKPFYNNTKDAPLLEEIGRRKDILDRLNELRQVSKVWLDTHRSTFPHDHAPTHLAKAMMADTTTTALLRALLKHHHEYGGGRHWLREQGGKLIPLVPPTGIAASDYRFRLRSLARLAAQCGVADLSNALTVLENKGSDEDTDEDEE